MQAVRRIRPGKAAVVDVDPLEPAEDEVVVDIAYAGVNPFDLQVLRGEIGARPDSPLTLGAEATGWVNGRLVLVSGCGLGATRDGTFATRVVAPVTAVRELPVCADTRTAAVVGVAGKTAWRAVHQLAEVVAGDVVLVLGASGGVGGIAAQLAREAGAEVLAHTASPEKSAPLADLQLKPLVATTAAEVAEAIRGHEVNVVLDPLGGDYVATLLSHLALGARIVTYGVLAGRTGTLDLGVLYGRGIRLLGTSGGATPQLESAEALDGALHAVLDGRVRVMHEEFSMADALRAFSRLTDRSVVGKLLLRP